MCLCKNYGGVYEVISHVLSVAAWSVWKNLIFPVEILHVEKWEFYYILRMYFRATLCSVFKLGLVFFNFLQRARCLRTGWLQ